MDCIVCGVTKSQTRRSDFHCLSILLDQWRLVTESEDRALDSRAGGFLVGVFDWSRSQSKGLCERWTLELCRAQAAGCQSPPSSRFAPLGCALLL